MRVKYIAHPDSVRRKENNPSTKWLKTRNPKAKAPVLLSSKKKVRRPVKEFMLKQNPLNARQASFTRRRQEGRVNGLCPEQPSG